MSDEQLKAIVAYRRAALEAGEPVWDDVECEPFSDNYLERIEVPGGWLYRCHYVDKDHKPILVTMCFVPRPPG